MAAETPWDQRLARWLVRPFARTPLRPNHITTLSLALGVAAGLLFARGETRAAGWGAALFMLARFVDHADGELARLTGKTSRIGYYYDYVAGALSSVALFAGIGVGYAGRPLGGWALALGLAASVAARRGSRSRLHRANATTDNNAALGSGTPPAGDAIAGKSLPAGAHLSREGTPRWI